MMSPTYVMVDGDNRSLGDRSSCNVVQYKQKAGGEQDNLFQPKTHYPGICRFSQK